jgi:hypothetical protein
MNHLTLGAACLISLCGSAYAADRSDPIAIAKAAMTQAMRDPTSVCSVMCI